MPPTHDFWAFSLDVYRQAGVAEACLELQDRLEADVNLVLFAAWVGASGRRLSSCEIQAASDLVREWQRDVVKVLRLLRRRLKVGPPPAPNSQTDALREAIKATELSAERIEQETLSQLRNARLLERPPEDPVGAMVHNIVSMLRNDAAVAPGEPDTRSICAIVNAAVPAVSGAAVAAAVAREIAASKCGAG